jgi:hypothetical protein
MVLRLKLKTVITGTIAANPEITILSLHGIKIPRSKQVNYKRFTPAL